MPLRKNALVAASLGLALALIPAPPANATNVFYTAWSMSGWNYIANLGNIDADAQPELLFASKADGHFAVFDGSTGALQQEFPQFATTTTQHGVADVDGDGQPELLFNRFQGGTPLAAIYHRSGATFAPVFSIADTVIDWSPVHLRNTTTIDILEHTPNDVRIRSNTGALLFRAATSIPGWTGAQPFGEPEDVNHDGLPELVVGDLGKDYHVFQYTGSFTQLWASTGWFPVSNFWTPGETQPTLVMFNFADGHYGLFNELTGTLVANFPQYSQLAGATLDAVDLTGDGRPEILLHRPEGAQPTRFQALQWNGAGYDTLFTHTDPVDSYYPAHLRSSVQTELVEWVTNPGEVRVRANDGFVLFRATNSIGGWSGAPPTYASTIDTDHDGVEELLINDGTLTRMVRASGTLKQTWSASTTRFTDDVGNVDIDPQDELMTINTTTGVYSLLDGTTGGLSQTFTNFSNNTFAAFTEGDFDHNGTPELVFFRLSVGGQPPLVTKYQWNGSTYATVFSTTDSIAAFQPVQLRSGSLYEFEEVSPSNDVLLRDAVTGAQLFRASTDLAGWTGVDRTAPQSIALGDFDGDGVENMLLSEAGQVVMLRYGNAAAVPPSSPPGALALLPSSPNPFRSSTALHFSLPKAGEVGVRIYDPNGRLVRRIDRTLPAGTNDVLWDGRDDAGRPAPTGVLFYEVRAGGLRETRRLVRLP